MKFIDDSITEARTEKGKTTFIKPVFNLKQLLSIEAKNCKNIYVGKNKRVSKLIKCHCNGKTVDLILIATEQHFRTKLNGAFSFLISCLVSEIFRFVKHAN